MDSFSEIAFGESTESLTQESHPFSTAFDRAQRLLLGRYFDPLFRLKKIFGVGNEKLIKKDIETLNQYAYKLIAKRRKDFNSIAFVSPFSFGKDNLPRQDLISQFVILSQTNQEELSDKNLRDVVMNFLVAGRDTTACALTWVTYELIQHPDIEKRVLAEIQSVFGDNTQDRELEPDHYYYRINQLTFTEIVILETLRLHPSVPGNDREAIQDDVLPDGSKIPKNTLVCWNPWQHNRSKQIWGDDVEEFKPSRWLDEDGKRKEITPFMYPTFSAGPRMCLGKSLALLEVKLLLSLLLPRFQFSLADKSYLPKPVLSLVLQIKSPGLPVIVSRRQLPTPPHNARTLSGN